MKIDFELNNEEQKTGLITLLSHEDLFSITQINGEIIYSLVNYN